MKALGTKMTKSSKDTITYTMKPNGGVIRLAEKKNPKNNYLTLTQENGNRAFDLAIKTLSKISKNYKLWLHIDGAYGLPAYTTEEFSNDLGNLSKADSIAFDFHKLFNIN